MPSSSKKRKYALIPNSAERCGMCTILASRGYAYKAPFKPHNGCQCSFAMEGEPVDGYDAAKYRYIYEKAYAKASDDGALRRKWDALSDEEKSAWARRAKVEKGLSGDAYDNFVYHEVARSIEESGMLAEMQMRSDQAVMSMLKRVKKEHLHSIAGQERAMSEILGQYRKIGYDRTFLYRALDDGDGSAGQITIQDDVSLTAHELLEGKWLSDLGYDVEFLHDDKRPGKHTPDIRLDGILYEMKRVESDNPKAVMSNCWKASAQSENIIIDVSLDTVSLDDAYKWVLHSLTTPMYRYLSNYEKKAGASRGSRKIRLKNAYILYKGELIKVKA